MPTNLRSSIGAHNPTFTTSFLQVLSSPLPRHIMLRWTNVTCSRQVGQYLHRKEFDYVYLSAGNEE
jgi:hypothetical protein